MPNLWFNSMRPWWAGFIVTWLVVSFGLRIGGTEGDVAVRVALLAALAVAAVIWAALRLVHGRSRTERGEGDGA